MATTATKTGKRVRYVWNTSMVAHLWANQSQSSARNSGGNFYFDGPTIYSYGRHFPIATIHERKGRTLILFNPTTYSSTTNRHQSLAYQSCGQFASVECPKQFVNVYSASVETPKRVSDHAENLEYFAKSIVDLTQLAMASRLGREWSRVTQQVRDANTYCEFWGLRKRFVEPTSKEITDRKQWQVEANKRHEANEKLRRERQEKKWVEENERRRLANEKWEAERPQREAQEKIENEERIRKWLAGESVVLPYSCQSPIMLRIRGSRIETSQGAIVELSDAMRLLPLIRSGREWHPTRDTYGRISETIQIGDFQLDRIDTNGDIQIGCHFIKREEMERLAQTIGLGESIVLPTDTSELGTV